MAQQHFHGAVALVLATSTGGIGQHVAALAGGLAQAGCAVTVIGPAMTEARFGFTERGAQFIPVEIPANPTPGDLRAVRSLRRVLAAVRPAVVHAHGLRAGFAVALARPPQPTVVTWHNAPLRGGVRGGVHAMLERIVARAATVNLGASTDLVDRAKAAGAADARLWEVAAPVRAAAHRSRAGVRAELGVAADAPVILSVGRLHPQKRYDLLVKAAAQLRTEVPGATVVIAGTGPSYLDLAAQISAEHAPVRLLGHRDDVPELIAASDVAVVSSDWEARQLFAQEALAGGLPLITTGVGGLPELVGDAAVLIEPGSAEAIRAAIVDLLGDPDRRAQLTELGRERAATWPDAVDMLRRLLDLYADLADRTPVAEELD
ncbi:glycosyltransferase involved in cell wall biosynthesis [Hamadaea flava]|uniref:Glycosyltransferase family 4 protein n=1 Tax=Hamadaea flava TaxID=1742688 RepID=A0ABV8LSJ3_9ACTN|nr:glycosyltransferase family 4 protein [Hamadaea flava]MCP2328641.1 glycosyltransferase involved in cell wall biosynthesis [Hamadaea flava]